MNMDAISKINLLILVDHLHIGGAETVVADLCNGIDRSKFNVQVCCIKEMGVVGEQLIKSGHDVFVLSKKAYSERKYTSFLLLRDLIKNKNIDIVHSHTIQSLIDGALCKVIFKNLGMVHTFHYGNYPNLKKRYLVMEKYFSKLPDMLVAVGNEQKKTIRDTYGLAEKRLTTIWNGVQRKNEKQADIHVKNYRSNGNLVIGTVCTLIEQKGLTYLLDVADDLKKKNCNVIFMVAGEGPLRRELEKKAAMLGLQKNVIFLGWVKNAATSFLPFIDIFFLPSLWEAMSVVVLEAMEAGLPVVVTDVGESRHIIDQGSNGYLVRPKEINGMVECLEKLISDESLRQNIGNEAKKRVLNSCSVEYMIKNYELLYTKIRDSIIN